MASSPPFYPIYAGYIYIYEATLNLGSLTHNS